MRKIILFVVLLGIYAALAIDVSFIDDIFLGQTKVYSVGDENLSVKILYFSEPEGEGSKVILSVNGEESKLLLEDEEDVVLEGRVIVRIYDIFSSDQKVRFGILGSGFSGGIQEDVNKSDKAVLMDNDGGVQKTEEFSGNIQEGANKNDDEENLSAENLTFNETDIQEENLSDDTQKSGEISGNIQSDVNEISENKKDVVDEQSVLWKSADVKENRIGFFARIWRWFISLFGFGD